MVSSHRYSLNKNKYLLPPEVEHLREIIRRFHGQDPRNCLLLEMALSTGARASELIGIQRSDVNFYDRSVLIRGLKGSNDREIPLHSPVFARLEAYVNSHNKPRVFSISYERLQQIWIFYRPVNKKFHSLRHTFAIELYQRTRDLRLVQVALGHRNIQNTMVYADYLYSVQELRRLILD